VNVSPTGGLKGQVYSLACELAQGRPSCEGDERSAMLHSNLRGRG